MTILAFGVLMITGFFWMRVYQAVRLEAFIRSLESSVSPAYLILTGLVFGLAGPPTAWGLWTGKGWAPTAARRYAAALAGYYWLDFLFFVVSDAARGGWPFALAVTVLVLAWVFWLPAGRGSKVFFEAGNGDVYVE